MHKNEFSQQQMEFLEQSTGKGLFVNDVFFNFVVTTSTCTYPLPRHTYKSQRDLERPALKSHHLLKIGVVLNWDYWTCSS